MKILRRYFSYFIAVTAVLNILNLSTERFAGNQLFHSTASAASRHSTTTPASCPAGVDTHVTRAEFEATMEALRSEITALRADQTAPPVPEALTTQGELLVDRVAASEQGSGTAKELKKSVKKIIPGLEKNLLEMLARYWFMKHHISVAVGLADAPEGSSSEAFLSDLALAELAAVSVAATYEGVHLALGEPATGVALDTTLKLVKKAKDCVTGMSKQIFYKFYRGTEKREESKRDIEAAVEGISQTTH